jgi:3-dehydroquinate dehydratase II
MAESTGQGKKILFINGPNLNLLGTREPQIYGSITLPQIESSIKDRGSKIGINVLTYQSNHEGCIIDRIQQAREEGVDGIVINPGGYTHTSVAIRDALLGVNIGFVECHVSNVHAREPWRHHSYFHDKALAVIAGLGAYGYVAALEWWAWKFGDGPMKGI